MEPGTRIVTLTPNRPVGTSKAPQMATFEEAFGEYSNLFGKKARARRAKRKESRRSDRAAKRTARREARNANKAERVAMRDERRRNKSETRQARRNDRKRARQEMRVERRRARKEQRQNMRAEQQAARMQRRMERRLQRQERKDLKAQREADREREAILAQQELESMYPEDTGGYEDDGYDDGGYDDGGYDDGGYEDDYGYDDDYNPYADPGYDAGAGGGGGYDDYGYEDDAYYGDTGGGNFWEEDDFFGGQDDFDYDTDYGYDDGSYDDSGYEDDGYDYGWAPFTGGDQKFIQEMAEGEGAGEFYTGGGGSHDSAFSGIQKCCDKIEWNKEMLSKMDSDSSFSGFSGKGRDVDSANSENRITALKEQCRAWVNFEDDDEFMGADGKYKKLPSRRRIMGRMRAVAKAKRKARRRRPSVKAMPKRRPNLRVKGATPQRAPMMGKSLQRDSNTKVEMGLAPKLSPNRIEIPASNFSGSGKSTTIPYKEIGIGLAVGIAGVLLVKNIK